MEIKTGVILRRGSDGLTNPQLLHLLENADKVQAITDEIEGRRAVYVKTEAVAKARVDEAEKAEAAVAEHAAAVTKDRADLDMATAEATAKQQAGMEALTRRTQEVVDKETAVQKRGEALDARENEIEGHGRTRENELRAREEAVEAQESAAEERDRALVKQSAGLDQRQQRLDTAIKMVKQAVASLG